MLHTIAGKLPIDSRWKLVIKIAPIIVLVVIAKFVIHYLGYEFLTLSALFTSLISANIFLIGFLISGVLVDYKESEKLPSDLSAAIETMADEGFIIYQNKKSKESHEFLFKLLQFSKDIVQWFYKKRRTNDIMNQLSSFNEYFLIFESQTQVNFIVRLKQEQNLIRKMINRIDTIRDTSFLGTGYAIAEIITSILIFGLIFVKMDKFYESVFFVSFVSFILVYMVYFIKDLDNPFGYGNEVGAVEDVSLKPFLDSQKRLEIMCETLK